MTTIAEIRQFVNDQRSFHDKKAALYIEKSERLNGAGKAEYAKRGKAHQDLSAKFAAIADFIDSVPDRPAQYPLQPVAATGLTLTAQDIEGLPEELVKELSISEADIADFAIVSVVDEAGGILSLDKILILLYKKTGEINKRTAVNARIYRMVQRGSMYSVPGKKGVYATRDVSEEEAASLA